MSGLSGGMRQSGLVRSGHAAKQASGALDTILDGTAPPQAAAATHSDVLYIPLDRLRVFAGQPRKMIPAAAIEAMLASYMATAETGGTLGPYEPLVVAHMPDGTYLTINGNTRLRAARLFNELATAGDPRVPATLQSQRITQLPVRVAADATDEHTCFVLALELNERQNPLNDVDKAAAYHRLLDEPAPQLGRAMTLEEVCERFQTNAKDVQDHLKVLDLPEPIRELIRTAQLEFRAALALAGGDDPLPVAEQIALAERAAAEKWSVRTAEQEARDRRAQLQLAMLASRPVPPPAPHGHSRGAAEKRGRLVTPASFTTVAHQVTRLREGTDKLEPARLKKYREAAQQLRHELDALLTALDEQMERYQRRFGG
jgi:ParB-like chromosome segregation protein Spo0J